MSASVADWVGAHILEDSVRVSGLWDFQLLADGADCSFFDFAMTWNTGYLAGFRIDPNGMRAALAAKDARMPPQVPFEVG